MSSFYQMNLKNSKFKECSLIKVDYSEVNMMGLVFEKCDFNYAVFQRTNIEKADFRTSKNYSIDPESNNIKNAKFSLNGVGGLLNKYNIKIE